RLWPAVPSTVPIEKSYEPMPVLAREDPTLTAEAASIAVFAAMLTLGAAARPPHDELASQATVGGAMTREPLGSEWPPLGHLLAPEPAVQVNGVAWKVMFQPLPVPVLSVATNAESVAYFVCTCPFRVMLPKLPGTA